MSVPSLGEEKEGLSPWGPALEWNCYWSDRHRLALGEATVALKALQANSWTVDADRQTALG